MTRPAFTLTELLLTIAIIIIISTFSVAWYGRFLTQNAVQDTVDRLVGNFRKAQIYAMTSKWGDRWGVNVSGGNMTLYRGSSYATRNTAFDEVFTINSTLTVSGMSDLNFMRITGTPSATPAITIADQSNNSKTVTMNSQGVASQ